MCEHADGEDDAHSLHSAWANVNEEPADPPPSVSPTRRSSDPMAKLAYNLSEPIPTLYVAEEDAGGRAQGVGALPHTPSLLFSLPVFQLILSLSPCPQPPNHRTTVGGFSVKVCAVPLDYVGLHASCFMWWN